MLRNRRSFYLAALLSGSLLCALPHSALGQENQDNRDRRDRGQQGQNRDDGDEHHDNGKHKGWDKDHKNRNGEADREHDGDRNRGNQNNGYGNNGYGNNGYGNNGYGNDGYGNNGQRPNDGNGRYGNGRYGNGNGNYGGVYSGNGVDRGQARSNQIAYNNGAQAGSFDAQRDLNNHRGATDYTKSQRYGDAPGWNAQMGDRNQYKQAFRQGYSAGYQQTIGRGYGR